MITIAPKRVAVFLACIIVCLTLASLAVNFSTYVLGHGRLLGLVNLFNVDAEANIPTWYASVSLMVCSGLLAAIAQIQSRESIPKISDWQTLSAIFLFLSIDELVSLHELLIEPLRATLGTTGIFYFAWVIPYSVLVMLVGIRFLKFLTQLPAQTRRSFILAGALYVGGALGMEMIDGLYASVYGQENFTYAALTNLEEFLEMLGIVVFIHSLLVYLKRYSDEVLRIRISNRLLKASPEMAQERSHI
jgi:hypothetical protein